MRPKEYLGAIFSEQFMDELAERVALKLAKHCKPNVIFKDRIVYRDNDNGCGSSSRRDSYSDLYGDGGCGPSRSVYRSGC